MTGRWFAPGRVNLLGEHTDYNGGLVLPIALAQGTTVTMGRRSDERLVLDSAHRRVAPVDLDFTDIQPGADLGWAAYPAGVVWAARQEGLPVSGIEAHYTSKVPVGAGLSSSAALSCATALALSDIFGWDLSAHDLARLARTAENVIAGAPTGVMDQLASVCGVDGHALVIATDTLQVTPVELSLATSGLELLVIDSRTPHALVSGEYADRRTACARAAERLGVEHLCSLDVGELDDVLYRRARHVITDSARVSEAAQLLAQPGGARSLAPLFNQSHESMRDDYEITAPTVDLIQQTALSSGAIGARMTGGGFGGCVIALIEPGTAGTVLEACCAASVAAGHPEPTGFIARAAGGAHRLD